MKKKREQSAKKRQSREKWAQMLSAWKSDPRSIPSVRGSQWQTTEKKYSHCLAEYPGDPEAYVSSAHEARETAKKKGLIGSDTTVEIRE